MAATSSGTVTGNLIYNNSTTVRGAGVFIMLASKVTFSNNTITKNRCTKTSGSANGGGIVGIAMSGPVTITGVNNIIYDNAATAKPDWSSSGATFTLNYSCSKTALSGTGNITSNPGFVNPAGNDFRLTKSSPCIDKGDPASPRDPDNTIADMGALYFNQSTPIMPLAQGIGGISTIDVNGKTNVITFTSKYSSQIVIDLFTIPGKKVCTLFSGYMSKGTLKSARIPGYLSPGIYCIRIYRGGAAEIESVFLLK